jgi:hypothetical protein
MPLKQVTFSKKYPYAQFLNYDIGYVWDMAEGDNREDIEIMLRKWADETHKRDCPQFYQEQRNYVPDTNVGNIPQPIEPQSVKLSPQDEENNLITSIESAKNEKELIQYKLLAGKSQKSMGAYNKRKKQLNIE